MILSVIVCAMYSGSNKAMLKVAHMCAQLQQYEKSIKLFEEVSEHSHAYIYI